MLKRYLPSSLLGRTILIILIPVLLLQITVAIVFFDRHWSKMTARLSSAVAGEMVAAMNDLHEDPADADQIKARLYRYQNIKIARSPDALQLPEVVVQKFDFFSESSPFSWGMKTRIAKDLSRQIDVVTDIPYRIEVLAEDKQVFVYFLTSDGVVTFEIPEGRLYSSSSYIFILWMVGLSALLFTIAMVFMRNQIRPIYRLSLIAERLGRGIPVGKIKPSGAREVRRAAEAFIKMQGRINQFVDQRTTMLAAVSHDLKTPLTRMKLQLELIDNADDRNAMQGDIHDMEQMIEGYLAFARGDGGEEMQRIAVADLISQIIDDAGRLGLKINSDNRVAANPAIHFIWGRPQALKRVFDNILSNANHFGDQATITFDYMQEDPDHSFLVFEIEDNGDGVPADQYPDLIKPFYRGETSRNLKTGGVGLGLAIAYDIVTSHGGQLSFDRSKNLGGFLVKVILPL